VLAQARQHRGEALAPAPPGRRVENDQQASSGRLTGHAWAPQQESGATAAGATLQRLRTPQSSTKFVNEK
jgi:hypothetical protein